MVTSVPKGPLVGLKEEMVGGSGTKTQGANYGALFIEFNFNGIPNLAHAYFKDIDGIVPDDFYIRSYVIVPDPLVGLKEVMSGGNGGITVKSSLLVALPPIVVTPILPVVAPAGTSARICISESTIK